MKFRNQYTNRPVYKGKVTKAVHLTVPDLSMSIHEILTRFSRGLPIMGEKEPIYMGEEDYPDVRRMDIAEIEEMRDKARAEYMQRKRQFDQEQLAKKKKADQGSDVQRTTGEGADNTDRADPEQYPKKTRGAGAAPRDTRSTSKGKQSHEEHED